VRFKKLPANALNLRLKAGTLRYLRRVGEKGEKPRPLIVGMRTTETKNYC
jgi:hypothetical protein